MRDLLIHYDEDRGVVVFHSVPTAETSKIRSESFGGVQLPVDVCRSAPPDEAERDLGRVVFSMIDLGAQKKIGVRDYEAEADAAHVTYVQDLELRAKEGDPEAQHGLFLELHRTAIKHYSLSDLLAAEALLLSAVRQGYSEAQRSLEHWPILKAAAERRIRHGKPD